MPTKATTLFSLTAVKSYVGATDTSKDADLVIIADAVSDRFERVTRHYFVTRSVTEVHDSTGLARVMLRRYPIVAVSAVSYTDTPGGSAVVLTGADYDANLRLGYVALRSLSFPSGFQNVTVTYTVGYGAQDALTLPQDIYQAGLDYVKAVWDEKASGTIATSSVTLGNGTMVLKPGLPPGIKAVLESWQPAPAVA